MTCTEKFLVLMSYYGGTGLVAYALDGTAGAVTHSVTLAVCMSMTGFGLTYSMRWLRRRDGK